MRHDNEVRKTHNKSKTHALRTLTKKLKYNLQFINACYSVLGVKENDVNKKF